MLRKKPWSTFGFLIFTMLMTACSTQKNEPVDKFTFLDEKTKNAPKIKALPEVIFNSHHNDYNLYLKKKDGKIIFARVEDVGSPIEICEDPSLLICMDRPLTIYLPKSTKQTEYTNRAGMKYNINVLIYSLDQSDQVCASGGLWLKMESENGEELKWYYFSPSKGLVFINLFNQFEHSIRRPSLNLGLQQGNIFTFDEICKTE